MTKPSFRRSPADLLVELRGETERLFNRHLEAPREWYPHELIDWGQGENFGDRPWSEKDYDLPAGVRSAIYVNLLTEDNLPYYTNTLLSHSPNDHPLREWNRQWTMEENRHAMVMRDWVHISRCIDPTVLENGRRVQMQKGEVPQPESLADLIAYVSFQERATQVAHRNTAARLPKDDKVGRLVLGTVAGDETKHFMFYRDLTLAAFAIDPSAMIQAVARQVVAFAMPGTGIPGFTRHAVRIAREGIYGLGQFLGDVVEPVLATWDVTHLSKLSAEADKALTDLMAFVDNVRVNVAHLASRGPGLSLA